MTETVNIEVYCDNTDGERDLFGVYSEHRPNFPDTMDTPLQEWVYENFNYLEIGDCIKEAGEMEYEPNDEIVEFREK